MASDPLQKFIEQKGCNHQASAAIVLPFLGVLAQLVRAPPCHGGGCGFEPRRLRFFLSAPSSAGVAVLQARSDAHWQHVMRPSVIIAQSQFFGGQETGVHHDRRSRLRAALPSFAPLARVREQV